jgi:hypothetical protein
MKAAMPTVSHRSHVPLLAGAAAVLLVLVLLPLRICERAVRYHMAAKIKARRGPLSTTLAIGVVLIRELPAGRAEVGQLKGSIDAGKAAAQSDRKRPENSLFAFGEII